VKNIRTNQKNPKKIGIILLSILLLQTSVTITIQATQTPGNIYENTLNIEYRNVTVYAPAVGETSRGYVGVISTITITLQNNGSGRVFVDTLPLAQIDMQGSARLAVNVATSIVKADSSCTVDPDEYDYFFVIRTSSPIIGGPSGGGILTAAVVSLLQEWDMDDQTVMTGMINPDASIGPVGGIVKKIDAAASVGARRFLIPMGQDTYTETVYETVETQWGTQIVTQQVTRNVYDYAMDNHDIEVIEVEDINDVLLYYTGNEIQQKTSSDSISTEQYFDSMKPLATTLLANANQTLQNATEIFDKTSIPNQFPTYYKNRLTDYLNNANDAFASSLNWFEDGVYYTSTSKSFQTLINTNFVLLACEYFSSENPTEFLQETLTKATAKYDNQSSFAKHARIDGAISLQCVGAAQKRATDAKESLSAAEESIQENEAFNALYQIAFANQRSESIGWWLGLSRNFNDTGNFSDGKLKSLSNDYIQDAQQSITYSGVILSEIGVGSNLLASAQTMLDSAKKDYDTQYYAAALFEALEALSKANLALELVNVDSEEKIQQKINRANESANTGISESRLHGIEPLLAVSYYEYAESLIEEGNVENALFYYKYSDLITGVLRLSGDCGDRSSRYVGIPPVQTARSRFNLNNIGGFFFIILTFGIIGGLIIGFIIGLLSFDGKKKTHQARNQRQQSIYQDYTLYPNRFQETKSPMNHYPYDTLPHTIHDYYKKQK
jgi:uncharacterized protein